jgi:hypothetical protein
MFFDTVFLLRPFFSGIALPSIYMVANPLEQSQALAKVGIRLVYQNPNRSTTITIENNVSLQCMKNTNCFLLFASRTLLSLCFSHIWQ